MTLVTAMVASAAVPEYFGQKRLSETTRVPIRDEYVPQPAAPVSLTTELSPNEAATPLLPEGMEAGDVESGPLEPAKRRWTLSMEGRFIWDDNIYLSGQGQKESDFVFLIAPALTWRHGDTAAKKDSYATAVYSPSASIFLDHSGENSVDHTARIEAQKRFGKLTLGGGAVYQRLSGATPELSDRVDRDEAGAKLHLGYDLSSRTGLETSLSAHSVNYRESTFADFDEWVSETYAGYALSGRTRVSAGGAFGRMDVKGSDSQEFQRVLVKATVDAGGKLTLDAKGGFEFRHTGAGDSDTPVFHVSAEYRPTGRTALVASAYREVTASGSVDNENLTRTGGSLKVVQKLGSRLTAAAEAGYEEMDYTPTESGAAASGREDEYFFIRPSLRYEFQQGRRAEIYYSCREDDSSLSEFDFTANQAGIAIGFDF